MKRFETNKFIFKKQCPCIKRFHHIVYSSGSPQDANTSWYITFGNSSGSHISFSASTNKTNLLIARSKIREVKLDPFSVINNFTLRTTLFSSLLISEIRLIGLLFRTASVWIKTISFILKFLFSVVHLILLEEWTGILPSIWTKTRQLSIAPFSGLTNEPGGNYYPAFQYQQVALR